MIVLFTRQRKALVAAVIAAAALIAAPAAVAAPPAVGGLEQVAGIAHCYTPSGSSGACTAWPALAGVTSIAITPNGQFAYVAVGDSSAIDDGAILAASRNAATGALTTIAGTAGCYSNDGSSLAGPSTCTVAPDAGAGQGNAGSYELDGIAISSDSRFLYAASPLLNAIVGFSIDQTTGALTQLPLAHGGCVNATGAQGCEQAIGMAAPDSLTLSPDGATLYSSTYDGGEIAVFDRNTSTGQLSQPAGTAGCINAAGSGGCAAQPQINGPGPVAVGSDDSTVYVANYGDSTVVAYTHGSGGFTRDSCVQDASASGMNCPVLSPLQGAYALARSPDGRELYVGSYFSSGVTALSIPAGGAQPTLLGCTLEPPPTPSSCRPGPGLTETDDLAAAPDGAAVYGAAGEGIASNDGGVVAFQRNPTTGALTQYPGAGGCQLANPPVGTAEVVCGNDPAATAPYAIAVSPDSAFVYGGGFNPYNTSYSTGWVTVYHAVAAPTCSGASVSTAVAESVPLPLTCTDQDGNSVTLAIAGAPAHGTLGPIDTTHDTVTYTPAAGYAGADQVKFTGSDGTNTSAPATVQIAIAPANLTALHVSPSKFKRSGRRVGGRCVPVSRGNAGRIHCKRRIKVMVSYTLSAAAVVTFTLHKRVHGRPAVAVKGSLTRNGGAGANKFPFNGRIAGHTIGAGSYVLTATPAAGAGVSVTFAIAR